MKIRLFSLFTVCIWATSLHATTFSFRQSGSARSSGCPFGCSASLSVAFASNNVAGNVIVVSTTSVCGTANPAPTDTRGNTYVLQFSSNSSSGFTTVYTAINIAAGANTVSQGKGSCTFADFEIITSEFTASGSYAIGLGNLANNTLTVSGGAFRTATEAMAVMTCHVAGSPAPGSTMTFAAGSTDQYVLGSFSADAMGTGYNDVASVPSAYTNSVTITGASACRLLSVLFIYTPALVHVSNPWVVVVN